MFIMFHALIIYTPLRSTLFSACRPTLKYSVSSSAGVAQTEKDHPIPFEDYVFIWDYRTPVVLMATG